MLNRWSLLNDATHVPSVERPDHESDSSGLVDISRQANNLPSFEVDINLQNKNNTMSYTGLDRESERATDRFHIEPQVPG